MSDSDSSPLFKAKIFTLFPELFPGILGASVTGRALDQGIWSLDTIDIREFAYGKHAKVDDTPCGGGAGMVMRADVIDGALRSQYASPQSASPQCETSEANSNGAKPRNLIYVSPRGKPFDQAMAKEFAQDGEVGILCGRFEGVDQRVLDAWGIKEVSLGDFVLSGGEIPAQAIIDASIRLVPGVLGAEGSLDEESFSSGLLEYPQFTRPREWNDCIVPQVLLSGNHREIYAWRQRQSESLTKQRRPDLWARYVAAKETKTVKE